MTPTAAACNFRYTGLIASLRRRFAPSASLTPRLGVRFPKTMSGVTLQLIDFSALASSAQTFPKALGFGKKISAPTVCA
jgi:hypothetical protein